MKVDNTALSAQIDATAVIISGLLDKVKAAVNDAATIADLQAQLSVAQAASAAAQAALDEANSNNTSLTADLAASQQDSADLTAKLKAVGDLALTTL